MTNPPPPPGGWPPPGYPPYPPPGGGYPPRQPPQCSTGLVIGMAAVGVCLDVAVNFVTGFVVVFIAVSATPPPAVLVLGAVLLAVFAFGGGAGLLAVRKPWAKGLGLGLMIGWALTSICTVGICTGLNPALYQGL